MIRAKRVAYVAGLVASAAMGYAWGFEHGSDNERWKTSFEKTFKYIEAMHAILGVDKKDAA